MELNNKDTGYLLHYQPLLPFATSELSYSYPKLPNMEVFEMCKAVEFGFGLNAPPPYTL